MADILFIRHPACLLYALGTMFMIRHFTWTCRNRTTHWPSLRWRPFLSAASACVVRCRSSAEDSRIARCASVGRARGTFLDKS